MVYYIAGSHSHKMSANRRAEESLARRKRIQKENWEDWCMPTVSVKLRPLGDRVVVKAISRETVTKSGIVLPDTAKEKPQEGEVLAVGPGKVLDNGKRVTLEVSAGQKVLFARYAGSEVKIDGEEYLILRESDIMGIVEQE
jgi:chaperonin GroES